MFIVGQKVRIKETAFAGSTEQIDIDTRGKVGEIVTDLSDALNPSRKGCYEVYVSGEGTALVTADEIEAA
jgi:hypothetical protein